MERLSRLIRDADEEGCQWAESGGFSVLTVSENGFSEILGLEHMEVEDFNEGKGSMFKMDSLGG